MCIYTREGVNKSALFRNESQSLYNKDCKNSNAQVWEFKPQSYVDGMLQVSRMTLQLNNVSANAGAIHINLQSPEGKELEDEINNLFYSFSMNVADLENGINLCGEWAQERYQRGVQKEYLNKDVVNAINVILNAYNLKNEVQRNPIIASILRRMPLGVLEKIENELLNRNTRN